MAGSPRGATGLRTASCCHWMEDAAVRTVKEGVPAREGAQGSQGCAAREPAARERLQSEAAGSHGLGERGSTIARLQPQNLRSSGLHPATGSASSQGRWAVTKQARRGLAGPQIASTAVLVKL